MWQLVLIFLEFPLLAFFAKLPQKVVELFMLYRMVSLSELSAIMDFFDVFVFLDILEPSIFYVIGPFIEAVAFLFLEKPLFLESLTPGTYFRLRLVHSVGNWDPSIT